MKKNLKLKTKLITAAILALGTLAAGQQIKTTFATNSINNTFINNSTNFNTKILLDDLNFARCYINLSISNFESNNDKEKDNVREAAIKNIKELMRHYYDFIKMNFNKNYYNNDSFIRNLISLKSIIEENTIQIETILKNNLPTNDIPMLKKLHSKISKAIIDVQKEYAEFCKNDLENVSSTQELFTRIVAQAEKLENILIKLKNQEVKDIETNFSDVTKIIENVNKLINTNSFLSTDTSKHNLDTIKNLLNNILEKLDLKKLELKSKNQVPLIELISSIKDYLQKIKTAASEYTITDGTSFTSNEENKKIQEMSESYGAEFIKKRPETMKNPDAKLLFIQMGCNFDCEPDETCFFAQNKNVTSITYTEGWHLANYLQNGPEKSIVPVCPSYDTDPLDEKRVPENVILKLKKVPNGKKYKLGFYDWINKWENKVDDLDIFKDYAKNPEIQWRYGGKFYGVTNDMNAITYFLNVLNRNGFIGQTAFISLNTNSTSENYNNGENVQGMEGRYHPILTTGEDAENDRLNHTFDKKLAMNMFKNCKNLITEKNRKISSNKTLVEQGLGGLNEDAGRKTTGFFHKTIFTDANGKKFRVPVYLDHTDFADNPNVQYKLYDDNSMQRLAQGRYASIYETYNYNPHYADVKITPFKLDNKYYFMVTVEFNSDYDVEDAKNDKFPYKKGKIKIGRADIDRKNWNENVNDDLLPIELDKEKGYLTMSRKFYPESQSFNGTNKVDFDKEINNEYYVDLFSDNNYMIPSKVTNFKVVTPKKGNIKDFNKIENKFNLEEKIKDQTKIEEQIKPEVEVKYNDVFKFKLDQKLKKQKDLKLI